MSLYLKIMWLSPTSWICRARDHNQHICICTMISRFFPSLSPFFHP
jgi:hypothetical protein